MDLQLAQKFAGEWINAWNSHDLAAIMAHYDDEIVFNSPFIQKLKVSTDATIRDKQTLRHYFELALQKYPKLNFELINCLNGLNSVVLSYKSVNDLYSAEYMEFNPQGKVNRVVAHYTPV